MFWNDPSMYGATLYKDLGKELYPREIGLTTPFGIPTHLTNPQFSPQFSPQFNPWMGVGYPQINTPFIGHQPFGVPQPFGLPQTYGLPQQNLGFAPPFVPWANPMLQHHSHVNPYARPVGFENQLNAFRPTIW